MIPGSVLPCGSPMTVEAQSFESGSNGSDGALNLTSPGTILFDPKSFNPPLDPDGDNIYHFTTINIAAGVTVKLSGRIFSGPVFWLASGAVQINGTIDLNGEDGYTQTSMLTSRIPSVPSAGGYAGGVGGRHSSQPILSLIPQPGNGPGRGAATGPIGFNKFGSNGGSGSFSGNPFLVPLVGGSGGGGGAHGVSDPNSTLVGSGGGAGGGAILIASSTSITFASGTITANGGAGGIGAVAGNCGDPFGAGGGGSGGAIRLVAPVISGSGTLSAISRNPNMCGQGGLGGPGLIRLEAFQQTCNCGLNNTPTRFATPFAVFLPTALPSVRVVSVAGAPVSQNPSGSFQIPDVIINSGASVPVVIEARNVPVGIVVSLHLFSETGSDQFVDSPPLSGTDQLSTATVSVGFPSGFTRGFVRATWTQ